MLIHVYVRREPAGWGDVEGVVVQRTTVTRPDGRRWPMHRPWVWTC